MTIKPWRDGEIKWLSGWLADQIADQNREVKPGERAAVFLTPAQWRAAVDRLRKLSDGEGKP
jgi:hypothetical protein